MYQLFEFTSLRQQVIIVREVTSEMPVFASLAGFCANPNT
jgi:hypothetical protein